MVGVHVDDQYERRLVPARGPDRPDASVLERPPRARPRVRGECPRSRGRVGVASASALEMWRQSMRQLACSSRPSGGGGARAGVSSRAEAAADSRRAVMPTRASIPANTAPMPHSPKPVLGRFGFSRRPWSSERFPAARTRLGRALGRARRRRRRGCSAIASAAVSAAPEEAPHATRGAVGGAARAPAGIQHRSRVDTWNTRASWFDRREIRRASAAAVHQDLIITHEFRRWKRPS